MRGLHLDEAPLLDSAGGAELGVISPQPSQPPGHEGPGSRPALGHRAHHPTLCIHPLGPIMEPSALTGALLLPFLLALSFPSLRALLPSWCVSPI